MILIIGGAFQGKTEYAESILGIRREEWTDGEKCGWSDLYHRTYIRHFHEFIKARLKEGEDLSRLAETIIEKNPDAVIVTNELGYGIVPADPFEREYREITGRVCTALAAHAREVHRVICGVGSVIKHA